MFKFMKSNSAAVAASVGVFGVLVASSANAALDPAISAAMVTLEGDATTLFGYGWALFAVVIVGLLLFKLGKKVFGKAT